MSKPSSANIIRLKPTLQLLNAVKRTYFSVHATLHANQKSSGNLSTRSLTAIVPPSVLVPDSEYLETELIAVPLSQQKDFIKSYETLAEMVVPRSANLVASDDEFALYAVTVFQKTAADFLHKCREKRWIPREFKFKQGGKEEEAKEAESLAKEERKVWGEALRLCHTGYSEAAMVWVHVFALRTFVETVLRYGLPLNFVCGVVQVSFKPSISR
jgi:V-type H+-transporting ATPase subunit C